MSQSHMSEDQVVVAVKERFLEEIEGFLENHLPNLVRDQVDMHLENNFDEGQKRQIEEVLNDTNTFNENLTRKQLIDSIGNITGVSRDFLSKLGERMDNELQRLAEQIISEAENSVDQNDEMSPGR